MKLIHHLSLALLTVTLLSTLAQAQVGAGAAIVAVDEAAGSSNPKDSGAGSGGKTTYSTGGKKQGSKAGVKSGGGKAKPGSRGVLTRMGRPPSAPKPYNGPVLGDKYTFLNYEVMDAVRPVHTNAAKKAGAKGLVQVEVLIDEYGSVMTAKARTGNSLLWEEAERAARGTRFNQPKANGLPARAMGFLVYRFGPPEEEE